MPNGAAKDTAKQELLSKARALDEEEKSAEEEKETKNAVVETTTKQEEEQFKTASNPSWIQQNGG